MRNFECTVVGRPSVRNGVGIPDTYALVLGNTQQHAVEKAEKLFKGYKVVFNNSSVVLNDKGYLRRHVG